MDSSKISPSVPVSKLLPIVRRLTGKIRGNPDSLIERLVPSKFLPMLRTAKLALGVDVGGLVANGIGKVDELPEDFWLALENLIAGVLAGDEEATRKLGELLGI